ncbi:MAG: ABC transporter ATP-binding protein, partial [Paracoccus sp. (in: a-proteobacteria)]
MSLYAALSRQIDAFRPAEGPPPQTLLRFIGWALRGSGRGLSIAAVSSAASGAADVFSAVLLGWVIDGVTGSTPQTVWADNWSVIAGFALFFLVLRPLILGMSTASSSVIIGPNILPLVLSRLHRWTMGQAVSFFDEDFAGRLAQKQMQTARAITDFASEMVNVVTFALASFIGSAAYLISFDGWSGMVRIRWL